MVWCYERSLAGTKEARAVSQRDGAAYPSDPVDRYPQALLCRRAFFIASVLLLAVLIYGTLQWSRRRRGPTQVVREESRRELYREGARAEKREEAGKASAEEKPTSQPPRQR